MQNVELELPGLMNALVIAENREETIRVYQFWKAANCHNQIHIHEMIMDKDESKVWVQFTQTVDNYLHGPSFNLEMSCILYLQHTPRGKRISKQVDYHSFESIFVTKPILNWFFALNRKASTLMIVQGTGLVAHVLPYIEQLVRKVKVVDEHWESIKDKMASVWWKDREKFQGVATAPYRPEL